MNRTITTLAGAAALGLAVAAVAACGSSGSSSPPAPVTVTHTRIVTAAPKVITVTPAPRVITVTPTAAPAPSQAAPAPTQASNPGLSDPVAVVTQFYADITAHDYAAAWALGGDNIAGTSYANWVAGYGTTAAIAVTSAENSGSDQVTASIGATQTDGSVLNYSGTYTVRNGAIVSAQITQQ
jgi:hypothetical protein